MEIRDDGAVGWSALLHEHHEGCLKATAHLSGQWSAPWGVLRSSELHRPAVSNVRRPLGLRQAAPSEVEAEEWLVLGWRLRLTRGGRLVNLSRALFLLLPVSPAAFLSQGSPQRDSRAPPRPDTVLGRGLTCAGGPGPAPGPGAPAAKAEAISWYSQQLRSGWLCPAFPPLLLPSVSGQWDHISLTQPRPAPHSDKAPGADSQPRANTACVSLHPSPPFTPGGGRESGRDLGICVPRS